MEELVEKMKVVLATTFSLYLKAHNFHWNVEGPTFLMHHDLFGKIYEETFGAVDSIAEQIRTLDAYAPGSLARYSQLSAISDELNVPSAMQMVSRLYDDNKKCIEVLTDAYNVAEKEKVLGLANFLQDRIDIHSKHSWMLKASLKV